MKEALDAFIAANKVVLFMKGNKNFPQCGFSNTCVQILNQFGVPYETVNILEDDSLRQGVKEYSNWPTFPQLYIDGEFFGGCDITIGEYLKLLCFPAALCQGPLSSNICRFISYCSELSCRSIKLFSLKENTLLCRVVT